MELISKTFCNPATGRYAWVGLDNAEVAYLNDFRWLLEIIASNDLYLVLEGSTVHIPRPKSVYATDMEISRENTIPFLQRLKTLKLLVSKYNTRNERETDMMSCRWDIFAFTHKMPLSEVKDTDLCSRCFVELVIAEAHNECLL